MRNPKKQHRQGLHGSLLAVTTLRIRKREEASSMFEVFDVQLQVSSAHHAACVDNFLQRPMELSKNYHVR